MEWVGEFTPQQWTIIGVVAGMATAVATALSAALSIFWRFMDRKTAAWITFSGSSSWPAPPPGASSSYYTGPPLARGRIANVGDAVALASHVVGLGCNVELWSLGGQGQMIALAPAIQPGDQYTLTITCEPDDWNKAEIAVIWTTRPALFRKRRVELLPLREVAPRPRYRRYETDPETGKREDIEVPEPPRPILPPEDQPQRKAVPTNWWSPKRRQAIRELRKL